jgi:hypothetical protein
MHSLGLRLGQSASDGHFEHVPKSPLETACAKAGCTRSSTSLSSTIRPVTMRLRTVKLMATAITRNPMARIGAVPELPSMPKMKKPTDAMARPSTTRRRFLRLRIAEPFTGNDPATPSNRNWKTFSAARPLMTHTGGTFPSVKSSRGRSAVAMTMKPNPL